MSSAFEVHVAYHESAHAICAYLFSRRLHAVSIVSATNFGGVSIHESRPMPALTERQQARLAVPLAMALPAGIRRSLEISALTSLVGPAVDEAIRPRETGYVADDPDAGTGSSQTPAALPARIPKRTTDRLTAADEPGPTDLDQGARIARLLSPNAAVQTLAWLRAEAAAMVGSRTFGKGFDVLVPALLERRVLTGAAAKRLLTEGGVKW